MRAHLIRRAVASILEQAGVRATPIVVVNGTTRDPGLIAELAADARIRLLRRDEPGLPAALTAGLAAVDTEWVATLDDDDRLLPGALARRVALLSALPDADVLVTGAIWDRDGVETLQVPDPAAVMRDPLRAFFRRNWLAPGSWLARTTAVGPGLFDGMPPNLECTFLALRFALQYRMRYDPEPTVVYHPATPGAASQTASHLEGQPAAHRALLALPLPDWARREVRRRVRQASQAVSLNRLEQGDLRGAWEWHRRTLREPGGWRHLPFTRRLAAAWLAAAMHRMSARRAGGAD
jgi:hypothetical protein